MKKLLTATCIAILLTIAGSFSSCNSDETDDSCVCVCVPGAVFEATDHWWSSNGKKILLQRRDNKFHIVFFSKDLNRLRRTLAGTGAVLCNVEVCSDNMLFGFGSYTSSEIKRATIRGYYNQIAAALSHTIHWAPYFRMKMDPYRIVEAVWITNLFSIKLKSEEDRPLLKKLAEENSVIVIGESGFLPGWYTLACTLLSNGNSLEMANLFFETGLFANYSPNITGHGQGGI